MNNLKILLISGTSFYVAYLIMIGRLQEMIHFAGPDNEMGCFVIASSMGMLSLFGLDYKGLYKWLVNKS